MDEFHPQPPPIEGTGDIWLEVIKSMQGRRAFGIKKYGRPVQLDNGRDHLQDLYEELLDAVVYLKQEIMRREREKHINDLSVGSIPNE